MNTLQKGLIVVTGLLILACFAAALAGMAWWLGGGSNLMAALNPQATATASPVPTEPPARVTPSASRPGVGTVVPGRPTPAPGQGGGARIMGSFGVVEAVSPMSVTVSFRRQTETVNVLPETKVVYAGKPNATIADVQKGDRLLAIGATRSSGEIQARAVLVAPASYEAGNIMLGQVKQISGNTLTIATLRGDETITTSSATQILDQTLEPAGTNALAIGSGVIIIGQLTGNTLNAEVVVSNGQGRTAPVVPSRPPSPTPGRSG